MNNRISEYIKLQDWITEHIDNGMDPLSPIIKSVVSRQSKLLKMMNNNERIEAFRFSEHEPTRYW